MVDIDKLNWFLPKDEQKRNRENIGSLSDYDIEMLILPYRKKECWLNCAILLSELDDVRLIPFLSRILEWYKDLNWPGSEVIHKRIKKLPAQQIDDAVSCAMIRAKEENDDEWYKNLYYSFLRI